MTNNLRFKAAGAVTTGRLHLQTGRPCDDVVGRLVRRKDGAVIALADGAGSACHGGQGAAIAVAAALAALRTNPHMPLTGAVAAARRAVERAGGPQLADYATTLQIARIVRDGSGLRVDTVQIGDGAIVAGDPDTPLTVLNAPARGEAFNETHFLTSASWERNSQETSLTMSMNAGLAAMSDGTVPVLLSGDGTRVAMAVNHILRWGRQMSRDDWEASIAAALREDLRPLLPDDLSLAAVVVVPR